MAKRIRILNINTMPNKSVFESTSCGFLLFVFLISIISCRPKSDFKQVIEYSKVAFELSDNDSSKIGLPSDEFEIGPTNMVIDENTVYFLDPYFAKVRSINLINDGISASNSFSTKFISNYTWIPWLYDLAVFNNFLYITNEFDSIFILKKDLGYVRSLKIGLLGKKYIYNNFGDSIQIYCVEKNKFITIDTSHNFQIRNSADFTPLTDINNKYYGHGYTYLSNKNILGSEYWNIKLNEQIQNITLTLYQCNNIAFNKRFFLHFSIDKQNGYIAFYKYRIN